MTHSTVPAWLRPIIVPDMIRVGGGHDGGYVLPPRLLRDAAALVSMGLGHNWQFEKDARKLNSRLLVHAYDHTVSARTFRREALAETAGFLTGRSTWAQVLRRRQRLREYHKFFPRHAIHYEERVHHHTDLVSVDIATVFRRIGGGPVFVKMDIEGGEYRVLPDVLARTDQVIGLAIEFHDTGPMRIIFERIMRTALDRYAIVHLHGNNFVPLCEDGFPDAVEITLAHRDYVRSTETRNELPLADLDEPNDPSRPDYRLL